MYGCYVFESGHGTRFADRGTTLACRGLTSAAAISSGRALLGAVAGAGAFLAQKSCSTGRINALEQTASGRRFPGKRHFVKGHL
jgi:hypothetical protein